MLPVVDKPAIQYVVEEAVKAGLEDILIITGRNKRAIEDHFDRNFELEHFLEQQRQARPAEGGAVRVRPRRHPLRPPARPARARARGVGRARHHVGNEPFAVLLADDLMVDDGALLAFDARRARAVRPVVRRVRRRSRPRRSRRTAASSRSRATRDRRRLGDGLADGVIEIRRVVEKPPPDEAPSNLAIIGRYVFTPEIFTMLDLIEPGRGGELQLTDAIAMLLEQQSVFGVQLPAGPVRRRPEDRLPARQRRARARSCRPRSRVRDVAARVRRRTLAVVSHVPA